MKQLLAALAVCCVVACQQPAGPSVIEQIDAHSIAPATAIDNATVRE